MAPLLRAESAWKRHFLLQYFCCYLGSSGNYPNILNVQCMSTQRIHIQCMFAKYNTW